MDSFGIPSKLQQLPLDPSCKVVGRSASEVYPETTTPNSDSSSVNTIDNQRQGCKKDRGTELLRRKHIIFLFEHKKFMQKLYWRTFE